jgi:iron complex outermembrane receptor protein
VNWGNVAGGRVAVLWQPQDALTLKFSALVQDSTVHGTSFSYIGLGDLQQSILPGTGVYDTQTQAYSLNISAKLGTADLVSLTGYNIDKYHQVFDYTPTLGSLTAAIFNGVSGSPYTQDHKTDKITEELRLSLPIGDRIDWVLGAFFTNERGHEHDILQAADVTTGAPTDTFFDLTYPVSYKEYAAFTDLTLHFTSRFNVQIGGRESQNKQTFEALVVGPWDPLVLGQSSPFANPRVDTKDNSFTYLVTPTFNLSRDLMLYARLASGYRPGGPNYLSALGTAPSFKPDTTRNYEIGFKGATLEHRLTVDASVYYIDWRNLQLDEFNQAVQTDYLANGSRAKSDGVELSVEARPLSGLKLSGWVAVNEAKLKEPLPPSSLLVGAAGDRLPFSSRFSGNIAAEEDVPLWGPVFGFAGAQLSYVGGRVGQFVDSGPRQAFPAYAQTNLRAGLRSDDWTVSAFANNVTDRRGIVAGGIGSNIPYAFQYIAPRTIGVSVSRSF